jgi:hypothetical protein
MMDLLLKSDGVQIGLFQETDIEEMCAAMPMFHAGMEATRGWALCHEPEITWPDLGTRGNAAVLGPYVRRYIVPLRWEFYKRMKKFGITAWGQRRVGKEWVPYCPPVGSGFIWRTWDRDEHCYTYQWYWYNQVDTLPDTTMRIKVWYEPDINGNYTSPAASALSMYAMCKVIKLSGSRAAFHASHLPTFLVSNPPRYKPGEEKINIEWADAEELGMQQAGWARANMRQQMDRGAAEEAVNQAYAANHGLQTLNISKDPVLNSESQKEREAREGNGIMDRLVWLDDYRTPVAAAAPTLLVDPLLYERRMDEICSTLVDFPLQMILNQNKQPAGSFDAQTTFARDRMKAILVQLNADLVDVIVDTMRDALWDEYVAISKATIKDIGRPLDEAEYLAIHRAVRNLVIVQPCTPLVATEQFVQLWELGLMEQEKLADHISHQLGIPREDFKITPLKRQRELEMEQGELAKEQTDNQENAEQGKLKLAKRQADDHRDLETEKIKVAAKTKAAAAAGSGGGAKKK